MFLHNVIFFRCFLSRQEPKPPAPPYNKSSPLVPRSGPPGPLVPPDPFPGGVCETHSHTQWGGPVASLAAPVPPEAVVGLATVEVVVAVPSVHPGIADTVVEVQGRQS